jgi:ATP-binding protein involved in chromosome partitioning
MTEKIVKERLKTIPFPGYTRDIVAFGVVKDINVRGRDVEVKMSVTTSNPEAPEQIKREAEMALQTIKGVGKVTVLMESRITAPVVTSGQPDAPIATPTLPGVKRVVAVASGKGGVGKSTVAVNLAAALQETGADVGVCDLDIHGPSVALMFGVREENFADEQGRLYPAERYGLKIMSMGMLIPGDQAAAMRGPKLSGVAQHFLKRVIWGSLDYLVLDLPPGTGDVQMTVAQSIALSGAVLVTTPQEVALSDVRKAATMFGQMNVEILGVVENMSYFICPNDRNRYDIFGSGGGEREARRLGVPLLGQIPLEIGIREAGDRGKPVVYSDPGGAVSLAFLELARALRKTLKC